MEGLPTEALERSVSADLAAPERQQLARAIASLLRKGYFSTVGASKVEGSLALPGGMECSLVDFAGQVRGGDPRPGICMDEVSRDRYGGRDRYGANLNSQS